MRKPIVSLFLSFLIMGALPQGSRADVLSSVAGGGVYAAAVGIDAGEISINPYSVDHALTRYLYFSDWVINGFVRVDPYNKIDWTYSLPGSFTDEIFVDFDGAVHYTSVDDWSVYRITFGNDPVRVAGSGLRCGSSYPCGDGGPATSASFNYPLGLTKDADGNLYITDSDLCVVRKVDRVTGIITRVAGTYTCGLNATEGPADAVQLNGPEKVVFDGAGNLLIADARNHCIRKVDAAGYMTTIAGIPGANGYTGDGVSATESALYYPYGVDVDQWGNVYIADFSNALIRRVDKDGTIHTAAGLPPGVTEPIVAIINGPSRVTADVDGHVLFQDYYQYPSHVWKLAFSPAIEDVVPTSSEVGDKVVISGRYFGTLQGSSTVTLDSLPCPVTHWSNGEVHILVPTGAVSGNLVVHAEGGDSVPVPFEVIQVVDCSVYTDKNSCNAVPSCRWNNKNKVCLPR